MNDLHSSHCRGAAGTKQKLPGNTKTSDRSSWSRRITYRIKLKRCEAVSAKMQDSSQRCDACWQQVGRESFNSDELHMWGLTYLCFSLSWTQLHSPELDTPQMQGLLICCFAALCASPCGGMQHFSSVGNHSAAAAGRSRPPHAEPLSRGEGIWMKYPPMNLCDHWDCNLTSLHDMEHGVMFFVRSVFRGRHK